MNKKNIFIKTVLAVILIVITLSIISCKKRKITFEESEFEVRFSLTGANTNHFSVITATSATYTYALGDSFTLTATKSNLSSSVNGDNFFLNTDIFFHYTVTPANVLNITATNTNSITFALTNMDPGSVRITAVATNNLGETNGEHTYTISLRKASYPVAAPPLVYVTTNQAGINGDVLTYGVQTGSDKRSTYQNTTVLSNISGSATAGISADGTVAVKNGSSGTSIFEVRLTSPNYVDYVVRIISEIVTVPQTYDVLFSLTGANTNNFSAVTANSATYTYAPNDSFTLTATKTNLSSSVNASNFFHYRATPANVLNITGTTTNSITFALTNMEPGSVRITAIATNNLGETNGEHTYTINLQKASYPVATPPIVYVTTNQIGITGDVLTYGVQTGSDKRSTYQNTTVLSNISGSATAGISADGTVTVTNGISGTSVFEVRLTSPNYVDYVVRITGVVDTAIRLKEIIAGGVIPTDLGSDPLVKDILGHLGANAGASIKVLYVTESGSGDNSGTDWNNAINGNSTGNNLRNTIANISDGSATKPYLVLVAEGTYKTTTTSRNLSFTMKNFTAIIGGFSGTNWNFNGTTTFSGDIGRVNDNTDNTYQVFKHDNIPLNNAVLYGVTVTGGNASGVDPFNKGGGMYNNGSSPRLVKVVFSGNSAAHHAGGGMYNRGSSAPVLTGVVFRGNNALFGGAMYNYYSAPVLTEVEFTRNNASFGGGIYNDNSAPVLTGVVFADNSAVDQGGGVYNSGSAPVLMRVVFSGNSAANGGGMHNNSGSAPVLTRVVFSGNSANNYGGGMLNNNGSAPVLTRVVFSSNNSATDGGGIYNDNSAPVLTGVVFTGNSAKGSGGGMYNTSSSPVLIGMVFRGNSAAYGGGMYNDNNNLGVPLIVNTIFAGNRVTGVGLDIAMDPAGGNETIRIAGSVLGIGLADPVNGIETISTGVIYMTYYSLANNGEVNFGANATTGILTYPTIQSSSGAVDVGLYVRRVGTDYYFSETGTGTSWHMAFTAMGGLAGPAVDAPAGAEDLTARDIAGNIRVGRPDAGVYEYRP